MALAHSRQVPAEEHAGKLLIVYDSSAKSSMTGEAYIRQRHPPPPPSGTKKATRRELWTWRKKWIKYDEIIFYVPVHIHISSSCSATVQVECWRINISWKSFREDEARATQTNHRHQTQPPIKIDQRRRTTPRRFQATTQLANSSKRNHFPRISHTFIRMHAFGFRIPFPSSSSSSVSSWRMGPGNMDIIQYGSITNDEDNCDFHYRIRRGKRGRNGTAAEKWKRTWEMLRDIREEPMKIRLMIVRERQPELMYNPWQLPKSGIPLYSFQLIRQLL